MYIILYINTITNAPITSYNTCCFIKSVDSITNVDSEEIIVLFFLFNFLLSSAINMKINDTMQCILGKQFNAGVSKKYIIFIIWLLIVFGIIDALSMIVGYIINIILAVIEHMEYSVIYFMKSFLLFL